MSKIIISKVLMFSEHRTTDMVHPWDNVRKWRLVRLKGRLLLHNMNVFISTHQKGRKCDQEKIMILVSQLSDSLLLGNSPSISSYLLRPMCLLRTIFFVVVLCHIWRPVNVFFPSLLFLSYSCLHQKIIILYQIIHNNCIQLPLYDYSLQISSTKHFKFRVNI